MYMHVNAIKVCVFVLLFVVVAEAGADAPSVSSFEEPDALTFCNGHKVRSVEDWPSRVSEIHTLFCDTYLGRFPEHVPAVIAASELDRQQSNTETVKRIKVTFDTPHQASFELTLRIPAGPGPFPLLLLAPRYYQIPWADEAVRRGYVVCYFPGVDANQKEEAFPNYENVWKIFKNEYPEATWSSSLAIQAWLASRCLDYLLSPDCVVKIYPNQIGIMGHSRYGKMAIYAAAFDSRFSCVVARSSGVPTAASYRFSGRQTWSESVSPEDVPECWVLPSLKEYYGKENELPIEANALLATIAPRHLMLDTAFNDDGDQTFAVERCYLNAKKAYALHGAESKITLAWRRGGHNPILPERVQFNLDFFDCAFLRKTIDKSFYQENLLHAFDWDHWRTLQTSDDLEVPATDDTIKKLQWLLGHPTYQEAPCWHLTHPDDLFIPQEDRNIGRVDNCKRVPFAFSSGRQGNIYFDPDRTEYLATVLWLGPWSYATGSNEGYGIQGTTVPWRLAGEGYLVVTWDQVGFGEEILKNRTFYEQNPHWSKLGQAVADVQAALDFLLEGKGQAAASIPQADPTKICAAGFCYGGMVAVFAAALDDRITSVASFSGVTQFRDQTQANRTGGLALLSHCHAVVPKLGLFIGREKETPLDYDDIIRVIMPRPCLIYAPIRDRFANVDAVRHCVQSVQKTETAAKQVQIQTPDDICRFQKEQQDAFLLWLKTVYP
ncbi:MAG: dienelactone hydrolase family protein [Planctomycetia bacterium]|nr:dienelactone hydrolase family protein [Planctomycetia bacterium]